MRYFVSMMFRAASIRAQHVIRRFVGCIVNAGQMLLACSIGMLDETGIPADRLKSKYSEASRMQTSAVHVNPVRRSGAA